MPLALVTSTVAEVPGAPEGVSQVIVVSLTTTTLVAAAPAKVTVFVPGLLFRNPLPVSVTLVPPNEVPPAGVTAVSVGRAK